MDPAFFRNCEESLLADILMKELKHTVDTYLHSRSTMEPYVIKITQQLTIALTEQRNAAYIVRI